MNWAYLHEEMMEYFKGRPTRDSTVEIHAKAWPRFAQSPYLVSEGYVPGIIVKRGYDRKVIFKKSEIEAVAFDDDPQAHIDVPVTLVGVFGSHAHLNRAQIDLAMPTIKLQCVGEKIPPPFLVDCSKLRMEEPYGAITLRDIQHLLPEDGTARFHPSYDVDETEIVHAYRPYSIPEQDIPEDYVDPNFVKQNKKRDLLSDANMNQQQLYEYMRRVQAQQQQQRGGMGAVTQPGPVSPAMALQLLNRQQQMYTQQAAAYMPQSGMMPGPGGAAARMMMPYPMGMTVR
ncbi:hypothetical protein Pmar_PMAR008716 [Perkinsus marinus ATCC 50983]|uniref:Uncharacterized protein n=1 Tax=Perkinsus marinus (strain ATCC 50983 / TXsc) TaxID=423536 RepID=C5L0T4_PERM5|nr:hypothetical protein Pmar_PMAR008716 [Perkinsus marinus ATCC 50983]EER09576.1 hypothetical protein Pmar_PMAR008716 [Perkinsus marinus ATCC 50983]|eukprot:XP_002777781.1 hypothetical protein Pmar_PMAR008716 [Perkinsus marinus ATCC 50983]